MCLCVSVCLSVCVSVCLSVCVSLLFSASSSSSSKNFIENRTQGKDKYTTKRRMMQCTTKICKEKHINFNAEDKKLSVDNLNNLNKTNTQQLPKTDMSQSTRASDTATSGCESAAISRRPFERQPRMKRMAQRSRANESRQRSQPIVLE